MTTALLDERHVKLAEELEQKRNAKKNGAGQYTIADDVHYTHLLGALGEVAAAEWYDVDVDTRSLEGGDDGVDIVVGHDFGDTTINVKATKYASGHVLIPEEEAEKYEEQEDKEKPDAIMLTIVHSKTRVEIAGWIPYDEATREKYLCDKLADGADGKNYKISQDELEPVPDVPKGDVRTPMATGTEETAAP